MVAQGYVVNNTGRSRHIFKRTVYPGQKVSLEHVHKVLGTKVPTGELFVDWLEQYLPTGWELDVSVETSDVSGGRMYKEVLTAVPVVADSVSPESSEKDLGSFRETNDGQREVEPPSMQYATPKAIDKMSARDLYSLRLRDNPKRILKHVTSIHKLRRTLALCKNDSRKEVLTRLVQGRIRELNVTL